MGPLRSVLERQSLLSEYTKIREIGLSRVTDRRRLLSVVLPVMWLLRILLLVRDVSYVYTILIIVMGSMSELQLDSGPWTLLPGYRVTVASVVVAAVLSVKVSITRSG